MGRGRWNEHREARREQIEGDLAALGNARVYLTLVTERVNLATHHGAGELLAPAVSDLRQIDRLIHRVQSRIRTRYEAEVQQGEPT